MDWIERLLHVSPDGGNGATEAFLLVVFVFVAGIVLLGARGWRARGPAGYARHAMTRRKGDPAVPGDSAPERRRRLFEQQRGLSEPGELPLEEAEEASGEGRDHDGDKGDET
jgi:hypothetical protein